MVGFLPILIAQDVIYLIIEAPVTLKTSIPINRKEG
jgi:hypothetical protein